MQKPIWLAAAVFAAMSLCSESFAQAPSPEALAGLENTYELFRVLEGTRDQPLRYVYAGTESRLSVYAVKKGRSVLDWEAQLRSRIRAMVVKDINGNGKREIVIATKGGRIIIYDAVTYDTIEENLLDQFKSITCMAVGDVDDDPQDEIIVIADDRLRIFDAMTLDRQWLSQDTYKATELLLANVDNDKQLEIVLNTGPVIDTRFLREDSNYPQGYGTRMRTIDLNGDGYPEVIGESPDLTLRIYDFYAEREIR